jgi:hypothetical protein
VTNEPDVRSGGCSVMAGTRNSLLLVDGYALPVTVRLHGEHLTWQAVIPALARLGSVESALPGTRATCPP